MGILEGPVICRSVVDRKHTRVSVPLLKTPLAKTRLLGSGFWGWKGKCRGTIRVGAPSYAPSERKHGAVTCSFSSSSDGNGSMAGNFNESDEDYLNSSVIEAGK